jgi:hypothetical protein
LGWILFRSFTYPETATRGGGFFVMAVANESLTLIS